jgi:hypothetical protein
MKPAKKRRLEKDEEDDNNVHVPLSALASLTHSDVVEQVKIGLSRFAPLELDEALEEPPY